MTEIMIKLADYYFYGIIACWVAVLIGYLVFSIRLIVTARRMGMDVCATAMIPGWNFVLWVRKCLRKRKERKLLAVDVADDTVEGVVS